MFSSALLFTPHLLSAATNNWSSAASLNQARSGSAAVRLSDGRILFTGGKGASGPLASMEFLNTDGSVSAGGSMKQARTGHAAVVLHDGRVLVAGGTVADGTVTNSADIYDPTSNTWTSVLNGMNTARSGETATLLNDGRVLIAAGQSTSGPTNTLEIYSPASNSFTLVSGGLSSPRQQHAAALLQDGRVLIAGGSDGSKSLSSADTYDPSSSVISSAGSMSAARASLSATTLLDGTVLLAGGNDGTKDLASADIYNPATSGFYATGALGAARSGHLAFLLPNNNQVLIAGGTAAGTTLQSVELFTPWTGAMAFAAPMSTPRSSAAGSALQQDGQLLVGTGATGSTPLSSTEVYNFATVKTDKSDYPPGTTVNISGSGWQPGETVSLTLVESPLYDTHGPYTAVADSNGNISDSSFVTDSYDANIRFYLTANGGNSHLQAQNTFTDGTDDTTMSVTCSPTTVSVVSPTTCTAEVDDIVKSPVGWPKGTVAFSTQTTGMAGNFSPSATCSLAQIGSTSNSSCSVTFTPSGSFSGAGVIKGQYNANPNNWKNNNATTTITITAAAATSLPSVSASGTYGGTATFTATLTSAGSGVSGKNISFTLNGTAVGTGTTNSSGVATVSNVSVVGIAAGTYNTAVAANFAGDSSYQSSSNTGNLILSRAALTITAKNLSKTYGQTLTFAGNEFTTTGTLYNGDAITSVTLSSAGAAATATVAGSPYSITPGAALGSGLSNYAITYSNGTLTVNAAPLTITAKNLSKNYGQTLMFAGSEFTTTGTLYNGDAITSVTLSSAGAAATAAVAGSPYSITPSAAVGSGLANYAITYSNGTLTVNAAPLTITAKSTSKTYGQVVAFTGAEFIATGLVNGDSVTSVSLSSVGAVATAPVTAYSIIPSAAVGSGLSNYTIGYGNGVLTVNPAPLAITANDATMSFGGSAPAYSASYAGFVNGDTTAVLSPGPSFAISKSSALVGDVTTAAAGTYTITPCGATATNYSITYVSGTLTINKATFTGKVTITPGDPNTVAYGGEATATAYLNAYSIGGVPLLQSHPDPANRNVIMPPTMTIYLVPAGGGPDQAIKFGQATAVPTYDNTTNTSGTKQTGWIASVTQSVPLPGNYNAFVYGDDPGDNSLTSTNLAESGYFYTDTVDIAYPTLTSNQLDVTKANLTITANDQTKTYAQAVTFAGTEFSVSGLVKGDTVTSVTLTSAGAAATATVNGSPYAITPSAAVGSGLSNYNITYANGTLTVKPAPLTITAKNAIKTYGQTLTFGGAEFIANGLLNSDTVTSVMLSSAGAAATAGVAGSPYTITPSAAVGNGVSNYTITYVNGTLTVNAAPLAITANSASKTYGQMAAFTGKEFTTNGLVNSDSVTTVSLVSVGAPATAPVTAYAITPSAAVGSGLSNYIITYASGTLTVNPAPLMITATDASMIFGGSAPAYSASYSGFVNGETNTVLSPGPSFAVYKGSMPIDDVSTAAAGTYTITPSGAGSNNYSITYVGGALTINKATLTGTVTVTPVDPSTVSYGQSVTATVNLNSYSFGGVPVLQKQADPNNPNQQLAESVTVYLAPVNGAPSQAIKFGTATAVPTYDNTSNTTGARQTGWTATITGNAPIPGNYTAVVYGDDPGDKSLTNLNLADVGYFYADTADISYPVLQSQQIDVIPANLTITARDQTKTYGQMVTFAGTEFSVAGLVNNDKVTSVTLTSAGAAATATFTSPGPTYAIVPSAPQGTGLKNYNIKYVNGALSVNQAPLTIAALPEAKAYGTPFVFAGTEFTASGLQNSDTVSSVTLASAGMSSGAAAGNYPIGASAAAGTGLGNYTIAYIGNTLTVALPLISKLTLSPYNVPNDDKSTSTLSATIGDANNTVNIASAEYSTDGGATWTAFKYSGAPSATWNVSAVFGPFASTEVLNICVRGTDSVGIASGNTTSCALLAVYDPTGGFVTGGGWITSPVGASVLYPNATGKANFGFNSQYKKGATTPTGDTQFQFQAGNLNFHANVYQWMVVSGSSVQYKGSNGTINGSGSYDFMLTACDASVSGKCNAGTVDTFRIKIMDASNRDAVVYDNMMGQADTGSTGSPTTPTTAIGGGDIVIHKGN